MKIQIARKKLNELVDRHKNCNDYQAGQLRRIEYLENQLVEATRANDRIVAELNARTEQAQ
jgi:hypothetical protein